MFRVTRLEVDGIAVIDDFDADSFSSQDGMVHFFKNGFGEKVFYAIPTDRVVVKIARVVEDAAEAETAGIS